MSIFSGGLASSGVGVRQWRLGVHRVHHILDPATGLSATPCWSTVSVAAASCVQANAASTAAIVLGERAVDWLEGLGLPARLVRLDGTAVRTRGWPAHPHGATGARGGRQPMTAALVATVGHGSAALWYLTRATGLVSLILLSATVVLGTVASVGWTTNRWPRFLSQSVHRNLSLFCLALVAIHIVSTVGDGYVPIGLADAVIPFRSPYRPIWVGLGALAFDMLLAVALTSALRRRIGVAVWRGVHWLAYACWPIAVVHGLGSGSDARLPGATLVFVVCTGSVVAAVAWRLVAGHARSVGWRLGGALAAAAVLLVITAFAAAGPLRPGWSHRAGTSSALLAQLSGASAASYASAGPSTTSSDVAAGDLGDPRRPVLDLGVGISGDLGARRARRVPGHTHHAAGRHDGRPSRSASSARP